MVYMFHILLEMYLYLNSYNSWYLSNLGNVFLGFGTTGIIYPAAIVISLLFESPFMNLERVLTSGSKDKFS